MKKLHTALSLFLLIILLTSCAGNKARQFNNDIVAIQQSVLPAVENFGTRLQKTDSVAIAPAAIVKEADSLSKILAQKINDLNKLQAPVGGEAFKTSVIKQMEFQHELCNNLSVLFNEKTSDDEKNKIVDKLKDVEADGKKLVEKMEDEQKAFADKFKLTIK